MTPVGGRIAVVGTSCAGKTTLARALSKRLRIPHTELDELYWGPKWTARPREEFRSRVEDAVAAPAWIIDGNYSPVRDLVWSRATTLVWLNYSFPVVFSRAMSRTLRRIFTRERLFAGNRERIWNVVDPDWIPWWVARTHHFRRREIPANLQQPGFAHLQVIELTSSAAARGFVESCVRPPHQ